MQGFGNFAPVPGKMPAEGKSDPGCYTPSAVLSLVRQRQIIRELRAQDLQGPSPAKPSVLSEIRESSICLHVLSKRCAPELYKLHAISSDAGFKASVGSWVGSAWKRTQPIIATLGLENRFGGASHRGVALRAREFGDLLEQNGAWDLAVLRESEFPALPPAGGETSVQPHNLSLGVLHQETEHPPSKDTRTPAVTAALFTIVKTWKQPRCPLVEQRIKKKRRTYTMKYYSALEESKILPFATWMNLEGIMFSETSQTQKGKYHMLSLICGIFRNQDK